LPSVVALLDRPGALVALRRGLAKGRTPLLACRSAAALEPTLQQRWVDAIILGTHQLQRAAVARLRERYPAIPLVGFGALRADDAELLLSCHRMGLAAILVEGVDDPVVGELVARQTATAARRRGLGEAPHLLRLTEPIQLETWRLLMRVPGEGVRTTDLALQLGCSREHLSRQFGAGGAPNLKRVINFLRIVAAAELAANPGYDRHAVARLTGFSSANHLETVATQIAAVPLATLARERLEVVLGRFVRVGMRSRQ
jgi:transcriptional regulator GlxA family with amidase domain